MAVSFYKNLILNLFIVFLVFTLISSPLGFLNSTIIRAEEDSNLDELENPSYVYEEADITIQQAQSLIENNFIVNFESVFESFVLELKDEELSFEDIFLNVELTNGEVFKSLKVHQSHEMFGEEVYKVLTSQLFAFNNEILSVTVLNANENQVSVRGISNEVEQLLTPSSTVDPVDSQFRDQATKKTFFNNMGIDIITREDWGAPSTSIWKPNVVSDVSTIVVHHTATTVDNNDPSNTVRSIYNYHRNLCSPYSPDCSAKWNDIGYNYLIDQFGNIYEGRVGGNGVIAAHSPPNYGTIGIAVLGNYSGYTPERPSQRSLELLIARLSELNDIDIEWGNTLVGHNHRQNTECPGEKLYELMPNISNAANALRAENTKTSKIKKDVDTMTSTSSVTNEDNEIEVILEKDSLSEDMLDQIERYTKNVSDFREYGSKIIFNVEESALPKVLRENKILLNDEVNLQPNYVYERAIWNNDGPDRSLPEDFDVDGDEHWYLDRTNVPEAWKDLGGCDGDSLCGGDPNVVVAVLDTGVAYETYIDSDLDEGYDAGGDFEVQSILGWNLEVPTTGKNGDFNEGYDRKYSQAPELSDVEFVYPKDVVQEYFCDLRELTEDYKCNTYELEKINHANDDDGHGTFVTTIIAGNTDDESYPGDALVGIAHNVSIMPVDVFFPNDSSMGDIKVLSSTLLLEKGINHAVENGADVINMSISGGGYDPSLQSALDNAAANNVVVVAAAGNTYSENANNIFPGAYDNVIVVGASTKSDTRANYSTYGSSVDLVAPVDSGIASQWYDCSVGANSCDREDLGDQFDEPSDFTDQEDPYRVAGTSFAAPQVAAAVALVKSIDGNVTPSEITDMLRNTSSRVNDESCDTEDDNQLGCGNLDIERAISEYYWNYNWVEFGGGTISNISMDVYNGMLVQSVVGRSSTIFTRIFIGGEISDEDNWTRWTQSGGGTYGEVSLNVLDGKIYQSIRGKDNRIYTRSFESLNTERSDLEVDLEDNWSEWVEFGGGTSRDISTEIYNGMLVQSVVGRSSTIFTRIFIGGEISDEDNWTEWKQSGGGTYENINLINIDGELFQSIKGKSSKIHTRVFTSLNGTIVELEADLENNWSEWVEFGGETLSSINAIEVDGILVQGMVGLNTAIYTRSFEADSSNISDESNWTEWLAKTGGTLDAFSMINYNEKIYTAIKGKDDNIHLRIIQKEDLLITENWPSWDQVTKVVGKEPQMIVYDTNLILAAVGYDGRIYTKKILEV